MGSQVNNLWQITKDLGAPSLSSQIFSALYLSLDVNVALSSVKTLDAYF